MTARISLDDMTSDQLDQLHAEIDRLTAELADYDERAERQKQRADEAEQHLRNIAQGGANADAVQAEIGEIIRQTHELRDQLRRAEAELQQRAEAESADAAAGSYAGSGEHAIADPARWLHIVFTSPHETTANTSALAMADHLRAEFPGVGMRISSNATEVGVSLTPAEAARLAQSGVDTPGCDCGHDGMGISWHGDDCPWRCGVLEGAPSCSPGAGETEPNNAAATEATDLRTRLAHALAGHAGSKAFLADGPEWDHMRAAWYAHADVVLTELGRELAALAEYENATTWMTDCLNCARVTSSGYAEMVRAEKAEAATTRVAALYEQWVKAGPPPLGVPIARWWDRRLAELRAAIRPTTEQPRTTSDNPPTSEDVAKNPTATEATDTWKEPTHPHPCTATIEGRATPGGRRVQCTREARHPENHVGPKLGANGRVLWTDHQAGAIPHKEQP